jgi:predicted ATP-dependent serine protease
MYVAAEEDVKAIKARGERLGINTRRRLRFVPAMGGVANFGELLMRRRPQFIITDSLDALTGRDHEAELAILDIMKKYAVELQAPFIVTSQVNKDGDYSGLMAKQHAVDVLLTFSTDDEERTGSGEALRVLETLKNRSGKAFTESFFEMTAKGLVLTLDESEGDDSEQDGPLEDGSETDGSA